MLIQLMPYQDPFPLVRRRLEAGPARGASPRPADSRSIRIAVDQISIEIAVQRPPAGDPAGLTSLVAASRAWRMPESNTVHLMVVSGPLYDHLDRIGAKAGPDDLLIVEPRFVRDPAIAQLARALLAVDDVGRGLGVLHVEAIGLAIVTRLLGMRPEARPASASRRRSPLQKWRLKRVVDHVEANLARSITLADLAAASGLTRMHFAAQFRVAMGMRPHDYILQRRIDRAKEMLRDPEAALVDVALSVGFQTQAHFTTVFKRFADETPHRWRRAAARLQPSAARPQAESASVNVNA